MVAPLFDPPVNEVCIALYIAKSLESSNSQAPLRILETQVRAFLHSYVRKIPLSYY